MTNSLYEDCVYSKNGQTELVIECVAEVLERTNRQYADDLTKWLLIIFGSLVFFMQAGFAMICAGCVQRRNVRNTLLKNILDATSAAIAFYICGYSLAYTKPRNADATTSFIGTEEFFLNGQVDPAFWFFKYAFSATSVTIVAGALAERSKMLAYVCYSLFVTGLVYPVLARALWSPFGFLSVSSPTPFNKVGAIDFSGAGVVHATGGMIALVAASVLGPRRGRFYDYHGKLLREPKEFPGHSIALQCLGTFILWFGWYGFNPGSALLLNVPRTGRIAARAAVNTSLAAAAGGFSALLTNMYLEERRSGGYCFSIKMTMNGILTGCVSITAACGTVDPWAACFIGFIGGWFYLGGNSLLLRFRIDDAVDAIPVHLFGGAWGVIAAGLFSNPSYMLEAYGQDDHVGWLYSLGRGDLDATLLVNQLVAILFILGWSALTTLPFFVLLDYMGWLRTSTFDEVAGVETQLDRAEAIASEEMRELCQQPNGENRGE